MADRLRVGVVTIEPHGWPWLRVLSRFMQEEVHPTAVWDYDRTLAERFAERYEIDRVVQRPEDMIGQVDAVLLAGGRRPPPKGQVWGINQDDHLNLARPFLENGIPVMIDKPLADKIEDAVEIVRLARTNNVPLMSCSANRYAPEVIALQQIVADEDLGRIRGATCTMGSGVSTLGWYLVHILESVHVILGSGIESVFVMSSGENLVVGPGVPAGHSIVFRWQDGRLVNILMLRDETDATTTESKRDPHELWPTTAIVAPYLPLFYYIQIYGEMYWQQVRVKGKGYYRRNLEAFFSSVRMGEPAIPYEHTLEITQALAAAERSAESGQVESLVPVEDLLSKTV